MTAAQIHPVPARSIPKASTPLCTTASLLQLPRQYNRSVARCVSFDSTAFPAPPDGMSGAGPGRNPAVFPSRSGPTGIGHYAHPFSNCQQLIGRHTLVAFMQATWPKYLKVNRNRCPKPEVQPGIVTGEEARLTEYGLRLGLPAIMRQDAGSHRNAIGSYAFKLHLKSVDFRRHLASQ